MKLVGLISSYLEGNLTQHAIRSLIRAELDHVLIYEGPAGEPIEADCPPSRLPDFQLSSFTLREGRWRTDARKRQAMLEHAQALYPGEPVWGIWLDGDEVLLNGEYLRDLLQALEWQNEQASREELPWARYPIRLVEADGAMSLMTGRVVRLDLIRRYHVSTSIVENIHGVTDGFGNVRMDSRIWIEHFLGAIDKGLMTAWPPLPCEPHIFHRTHLRHPNRRVSRLSEQETSELQARGIL